MGDREAWKYQIEKAKEDGLVCRCCGCSNEHCECTEEDFDEMKQEARP